MSNRIQSIELHTTRFDPMQAEVTVTVRAEPAPDLHLRGRLMGPRCVRAETVEIAYPLRALTNEGDALRARVIIPESSLWTPKTPYLYEGPIELWDAGQRLERAQAATGLRQLRLKGGVLRLNGTPIRLHGVIRHHLPPEAAALLSGTGIDLLLTSTPSLPAFLDTTDRVGFLVLARYAARDHLPETLLRRAAQHPSFAGWIIAGESEGVDLAQTAARVRAAGASLVGCELGTQSAAASTAGIDFALLDESERSASDLPYLVRTAEPTRSLAAAPGDDPRVIGWVCAQ